MSPHSKLLVLLLALVAPAASADFHFYGGGSFISGQASEVAADGWDFGFGGIADSGDAVAWRWDLGFDGHDMRPVAYTNAQADDGDIATTYMRFGPQWNFDGYDDRFYINAMVGYYWTTVQQTADVLVAGIVCDPYWGWCWNVLVPGQQVLEERQANDWGYSATMGYEWQSGDASWFIELQYHQARAGEGYAFAPLVIGLRF